MVLDGRDVAASTLFALAAMAVLWPPGAVYWERVATVVGDGPTLALVGCLAVGLGAAFARLSGMSSRSFAAGVALAYAAGMVAVELRLDPDSPAHLVWYAALAAALLAGTALWGVYAGRIHLPRPSTGE